MIRKTILLLLCGFYVFAQNPDGSKYLHISYFKANTSDFLQTEMKVWKPVKALEVSSHQKVAWYFYKVKHPTGSSASYDYVSISVFKDWEQLGAKSLDNFKKVHGEKAELYLKESENSGKETWNQVFQLMGQAVEKEKEPSKFIIVNEMKVKTGETQAYVNLELTYFKPFHTARAEFGIMNNWGLYRNFLPYGEKYESDYVTFNGYSEWGDIMIQNPPNPWKAVHGDIDFNKIHEETVGKRATTNNELWELVDYVVGRN